MSQVIEELAQGAVNYQPNPKVAAQLQSITLVPIIGPAAVGKNTCIEAVAGMDPEFGRVQSFTTRSRRTGEAEDEYRFLPHSSSSLEHLGMLARQGELVQYAVHPMTQHIYGSDMSDYQRPYMMLDTLASAICNIRQLPFGRRVELTLVAEPEEWRRRFAARNFLDEEAGKRLQEGISSLKWALDQGSKMPWIDNSFDVSRAAQDIRGIVRGEATPNPANRRLGERLLHALRQLV